MFSKHRVEALSDGIFAIAMPILILDIKAPIGSEGTLTAALLKERSSWISFAISFLLAGVFWMHQHRVLDVAATWSKANVILTFLFLAFVCTLPFSTSVWGHHLRDPLAMTIYFANQMALALVLLIQLWLTVSKKHFHPDAPVKDVAVVLGGLALAFGVAAVVAQFRVAYSGIAAVILIAGMRIIKRRMTSKTVPA